MVPNENDETQSNDDLAENIGKLSDEIDVSKGIFEKTVKNIKKNLAIIGIALIILTITLVVFVFFIPFFSYTTGYALRSNYEMENMNGNKITTWVSWHVGKDDQLHIHVQDSPEVTKERMHVIADVILSNKTISVGNKTYYAGWLGAIQDTHHQNVVNAIPFHFHVMNTSSASSNVVIKLANLENHDGYTGYTKIIASNTHHQILQSIITIYRIDELTDSELALVMRHELGHAFGLTHSDNPDDLMYSIISRSLPYVSKCDAQAIVNLYNGTGTNTVTC